MANKTKSSASLPTTMTLNKIRFNGEACYKLLNQQLQMNFQSSSIPFSTNNEIIREQLNEIYRRLALIDSNNIWEDYINSFTLEEITSKFLKYNVDIIAPLLTNIFNSVLQTGHILRHWMTSYITPIPKKGSTIDINNCRGIAMSSIPKVFDKLLTNKLYRHLDRVLPDQQHGFRMERSTTKNLLELTNFIRKNINEKSQVDLIYFDFSKAFDRVDHYILAKKLAKLAMPYLLFITRMCFVTLSLIVHIF